MNTQVINFESAYATVAIDAENKTIFIENLEAVERGLGHATELLNIIKRKYPDYVICGNMHPTDFSRPPRPSAQDMEMAYELGYDFKKDMFCGLGHALTSDEKIFIEDVATRYHAWKNNDPFGRLYIFYRKNHFAFPAGVGCLESKPPHTLYI